MVEGRRKQREVNPRTYPSDNKRPTISFRVRADAFEKLKTSAKEHDLSLSEEVERCVNFKFSFARDAHDELVMQAMRTALDMAEKIAGERWFENKNAAKMCHAALVKTADLLVLGLGLGDEAALNGTIDQAAVAVSSMAINQTAGFGMTEARRRYEEAVESYKHFDRERYIMQKATSEAGLSTENALRPATPD